MKKIIGSQNLWVVITIIILILVIPYALCWFWYTPRTARQFLYDWRLWCTVIASASFLLTRAKIYCREVLKINWLNTKKGEIFVDIPLSILILTGGLIFFTYTLPALLISKILYNISNKKYASKAKKIEICITLVFVIFVLKFSHNQTLHAVSNFLFFITTLKIVLYVLISFISSIREDELFVDRIIAGLYWMLSTAGLNIMGSPYRIHGKLPYSDEYQAIYSNHGSSVVDYLIPNVIDTFTPVKPLAGRNLLKYPVLGDFIEITAVMTERPDGNTKKFFPWLCNQFLQLILFLFKKFLKKDEKLKKNRIFVKLWDLTAYKKSIKHNAQNVRTIGKAIARGFKIFVFPDGRDRLSYFLAGIMKRHATATARFVNSAVPILIVGSMHYRPSSNKEPLKKELGWKFQIWFSACFIDIYIFEKIDKLPGETEEEFTKRIDDFLYDEQSKLGFVV